MSTILTLSYLFFSPIIIQPYIFQSYSHRVSILTSSLDDLLMNRAKKLRCSQTVRDEIIQGIMVSKKNNAWVRDLMNEVKEKEMKFIPIQTIEFFDLAIGGKWNLIYTDSELSRSNLKCEIHQDIQVDGIKGEISNIVKFSGSENGDEEEIGTLIIKYQYEVTSKGNIMVVSSPEHTLISDIKPDAAEETFLSMQRSIPLEVFDPESLNFAITYVDPFLRLCRVRSQNDPKMNILQVFTRA